MWASRSQTTTWWVMGSTTGSSTATCPSSAACAPACTTCPGQLRDSPGARLARLLDTFATQDFGRLVSSGLLRDVEEIVVAGHQSLYTRTGREWSRPLAYQWLRYEDPAPVARLQDGVRRLRRRRAQFDGEAVDKAWAKASELGVLN